MIPAFRSLKLLDNMGNSLMLKGISTRTRDVAAPHTIILHEYNTLTKNVLGAVEMAW